MAFWNICPDERFIPLLIAVSLILAATPASAEEWQIEMDPRRTSVSFKLKATMHTVHGTAAASASLRLNTEDGVIAGEVAVDATTAETGKIVVANRADGDEQIGFHGLAVEPERNTGTKLTHFDQIIKLAA